MGKKSKKKVQWRRLSLNELPSNTSKWQQRSTPDRDDACSSPAPRDWDSSSPQRADQKAQFSKRGPQNFPPQSTGPRASEQPLSYGENGHFHRSHEDEYSNYHNHMKNFGNHRYNIHDKNLHLGGPNHPHFINGGGMAMPRHEYHYSRNGHPMDRIPYKNFDRDRPRFFNNGFQPPPPPHLERFHRGEPLNCPNGFPMDRRRPPFRVNGRSGNFQNFNGSPVPHRRWSNSEEGAAHCQQRFGSHHHGNGYRYRDRSNCGNGHDSGGSNGYEGGSSETQSEPDERCAPLPPVQSIFIDNDQYTKIQTPRQEVIFKKNSYNSASPSRTQESVVDYHNNNVTKRSNSSSSTHSKNKKNKSDSFSPSKADPVSKKESSNSSKKLDGGRKTDTAQPKKNQSDSSKNRGKTGSTSKAKSNSKSSKKSSPNRPSPAAGLAQEGEGVMPECRPAEGEECSPDSEEEETFAPETEAVYPPGITEQCEGYPCAASEVEDPTLAGVIMQQCYPGGPLVAIPVRWASTLDPTLIPGETALTPLDPAFTHLLDPSFQPLDSSKWTAEGDEAVPPSVVIPETVIPMQHDASGCPVTVQVKVDEHGNPLQIEPSCLAVQMSTLQHHPGCQMAAFDHGYPLQYAQRYYAEDNYRGNSFEYNFDEGLEKRLEQKIDEELAKHYSDEESDVKETKEREDPLEAKKTSKQVKRRDSGDCEETSYDSQYASMSEGSSLPTSPAGELSDSSTACPPNTPSTSGNVSPTSPDILESSIPPLRESSPDIFSGTPNASSISMSSASTLCASSSSSTLVSLSSSPVNSGNPSKETSPSSPRTEFSPCEPLTTTANVEESSNEKTPVKTQPSGGESKNGSTDLVEQTCVTGSRVQQNEEDDSSKASLGVPDETVKEKELDVSNPEAASLLEAEATSAVCTSDSKSENVCQPSNVRAEETSLSTELAVTDPDGKNCSGVEATESLALPSAQPTENGHAPEEVLMSGATTNPDDATAQIGATSNAVPSDLSPAEEECVMVDENGMKVTVKQGYIMVPILTPYYDPSVLYGYSAAPSEAPLDPPYPPSGGGRKKKKKQNKRRAMELNQANYMDADLYAGEPYVTTPEGYLLPMDPTQLCQYPQPGPLYMPAVAQYPYSILPPGTVAHQYPAVVDEGFVSVESTPQVAEHIPEPLCSDCVAGNDVSHCSLPNQDDCSKFGPLEENEKQQIEEILSEEHKLSTVEPEQSLSQSDVSEEGGHNSAVEDPCETPFESPKEVITSSITETMESPDDGAAQESIRPVVTESTEQIEVAPISSNDRPENDETTEGEGCTESIPRETLEDNSHEVESVNEEFSDYELYGTENADLEEPENSAAWESSPASSPLCQSNPSEEEKSPVFDSLVICSQTGTEDTATALKISPDVCSPISHDDSSNQGSDESLWSNGIPTTLLSIEQSSTPYSEAENQREASKKVSKSSNLIQNSRTRDSDRLNTSILRCARDEALESIAEESCGSLSDSSICSEEPELISQLTEEMESALFLLHSREEKRELPVTQAVKRWIREVTPEKIFTLTSVDESCVSALSLESTSSEDEYSEDEYHCESDSKFSTSSTLLNSTKNDISLDESPKNVKGNPFGCAQCSEFCTEATTKRVANCSSPIDVLEDYDGSSSVSSLSQGPLFSNTNSLVSSKSSSRTITPSRSLSEGEDSVDVETKTCRCHPVSYKKYYQLTMEVEDTPSKTTDPQSPSGFAHSQASSSDQVLPRAAEILRSQQQASLGLSSETNGSTTTSSLQSKSSPTSSSTTSSGLGSSVATTPNSSPHRLPPHSSAPRFPFILLPPNVRAETGPASLNSIHCCSIM